MKVWVYYEAVDYEGCSDPIAAYASPEAAIADRGGEWKKHPDSDDWWRVRRRGEEMDREWMLRCLEVEGIDE